MKGPFAHVMGTLDTTYPPDSLESRPREQDPPRATWRRPGPLTGNVVVPLKSDKAWAPVRRVLLATVRSCQELVSICSRLGLPESSLDNKLAFGRAAFAEPSKAVNLPIEQRQVLAAIRDRRIYSQNVTWRRKPRFRTHAPGLGAVIGANCLFIWLVLVGTV